ncbi:MAG: translation initiation factor IF-2 N-terminal domain-containing protein, partial [Raoultibacter sp.]
MADMRVHELAKEFDMSSKEMLDRLQEMKIPAKSHASMLADAYVAKIRKNLEPEIKQRAGQLEDKEAAKLAEEQRAIAEKKAEEERERREAVEQERARREAERAQRGGSSSGEEDGSDAIDADEASDDNQSSASQASAFESLASQIESEKERVIREAEEAKARARAAVLAKEVAKK